MKFTTIFTATTAIIVSVYCAPVRRAVNVNETLVPEFGLEAGINPTGSGDCEGITGANGKPVLIPCACPPARDVFIQKLKENVDAGRVVNNPSVGITFPEDDSTASQLSRIGAALVTLQNLNGPGEGCPASSTTFSAQQKAIQDGTAAPAPAGASAAAQDPAPTVDNGAADPAPTNAAPEDSTPNDAEEENNAGVEPNLVPDLGIVAGANPSGSGDCDGATGSDGKAVLIPCSCPPSRDELIKQLNANVANGFAVNNPDVKVSFPTDNSTQSEIGRITAVLISLQNLEGPGVGCPAASTTLVARQKELQTQV